MACTWHAVARHLFAAIVDGGAPRQEFIAMSAIVGISILDWQVPKYGVRLKMPAELTAHSTLLSLHGMPPRLRLITMPAGSHPA
jgi:hypothetical protein